MSEQANPSAQETPKADGQAQAQPAAEQKPAAQPAAEPKPEAAKPAEAPTAQKPVVPEKYELKLPEGSTLDAAHVDKVAAYAKERGLSNEQAQALLERESQAVAGFQEKQAEELKQKPAAWLAMAEADKEIGGETFKENAELAKRVVDRFGTDEFKKALSDTGLGNHPELVRVFVRIGKSMSEDQLVIPGAQQGGGKKSMEDIFYGKSE